MDNVTYMMNTINRDAVFAQLDIVTTGTCYDEGMELFRFNSNGEKIGKWNVDLSFDALVTIAKYLMKERKSSNLSKEECGEFQGFVVKVIYNNGTRCHFEVTADGQVSEEYNEWKGHDAPEVLN